MNKTLKKTVVALLCMTSAVMVSAGVNAARNNFNGNGYAIVRAEETTSEIALDLSKKHTDTAGGFNASNTIFIWWQDKVQNSGMSWGGMNINCTDTEKLSDLIELETYDGTKGTLTELSSKITRVIVVGDAIGINLEVAGFEKSQVKYVTLKKGFAPVVCSDNSGWGNNAATSGTAKTEKALQSDIKLYMNQTSEYLEKAVNTLTLKSAPDKVDYEKDDKFASAGMKLTATYFDGSTEDIDVTDGMCSYDFSEIGEKQVAISYHGSVYNYDVTVSAPTKKISSIEVKSGVTATVEQYTKKVTLSDGAKLTVSYSDESSEDVDLTADMISDYKNETVGNDKATVTYKTATCKIDYSIIAYTGTSSLQSVKYGAELKTDGVGGFEFNRTDSGLKALWDTDKADSAIIGKKIGDLVKINGETVSSLVSAGKVSRMWEYGTYIGFHCDNAEFAEIVKNGAEIELLPGFSWVTSGGDSWGANGSANYTVIEETILTKSVYLCFRNGKACKVLDSVSLSGTPKTQYNKGDILDVNGLQLKANYKGLPEESIDVTSDMCTYDFSTGGEKTVTISFEGKDITFTAKVAEVWTTGLELVSAPTKTSYDFGIENEIDLTGIEVKVKYSDESSVTVDAAQLTINGFDSRKFGEQTITATYGEYQVTFNINVENISTDKYLSIDYHSSTPSYETTQHNSLVVPFILNGVYEDLGIFWKLDKYDYVTEYILIDDIPLSQLIEEGKVTRLAVWTNQLVIHMDTSDLVASTTHPRYVEGQSKVVETVTFLPGLQWYRPAVLDDALWGNDAYADAVALSGAVLKEKIVLTNEDGFGWTRGLKTDTDGNIASDALTLVSAPDKTEYVLGESFNVKGMKVLVKYADGGEETVAVGYSDVEGYKKNVLGEQTLTYTYGGGSLTFKVNVVEESTSSGGDNNTGDNTENPGSGCNGCSGSIGIGNVALAGIAILGSAFIVLRKKKD